LYQSLKMDNINVGEIVLAHRKRLGMRNTEFAQRMNIAPSTAIGMYKRPDLYVKEVFQMGLALDIDLLQELRMKLYLSVDPTVDLEQIDIRKVLNDYSELKKEFVKLEEKCADLKQINELQGQLLSQMKTELVDIKAQNLGKKNAKSQ